MEYVLKNRASYNHSWNDIWLVQTVMHEQMIIGFYYYIADSEGHG